MLTLSVWRFWKVRHRLAPGENQPGGDRSGQPEHRAGYQAAVLCPPETDRPEQVRAGVPGQPGAAPRQGLHRHRPPPQDSRGQRGTLPGCGPAQLIRPGPAAAAACNL